MLRLADLVRILVVLGPLCPLRTLNRRLVIVRFLAPLRCSIVFAERFILNCLFFVSSTFSVVTLFFLLRSFNYFD